MEVVLPHLSCHVVPPPQLIGKTLPCASKTKANSAERFCCEELDFGIGVVWLHQACGVHLDPLKIDCFCTDGLTHLDRITSAVLTVLLSEGATNRDSTLPPMSSE